MLGPNIIRVLSRLSMFNLDLLFFIFKNFMSSSGLRTIFLCNGKFSFKESKFNENIFVFILVAAFNLIDSIGNSLLMFTPTNITLS